MITKHCWGTGINLPTELNEKFQQNIAKLDSSQKEAVFSSADKILIKAPAGSGKTLCLTNAIAHYRYEYLNDKICAITYTRAAKAEMEQRLYEMGVTDVMVSTIHVWCRTQLEKLSSKYNFELRVINDFDIKTILHKLCQEYLRQHLRTKSINEKSLFFYVMGTKNMDIDDKSKNILKSLESRYILYKRSQDLYDFTDFPLYLKNVLDKYNETINDIDALFVDEFQDVDPDQLYCFQHTNAKKKFYIGDPWQAIFGFRGATSDIFDQMPDSFTKYKLMYNYRSYQEIINLASAIKPQLQINTCIADFFHNMPEKSTITCNKGSGAKIWCFDKYGYGIFANNSSIENLYHGDLINTLADFKQSYQPMILCRTNKQVHYLEKQGWYNASTIHQAKGLEYDNVLLIDSPMQDDEDPNVAYVGMTRAKNNLYIINWTQLEYYF